MPVVDVGPMGMDMVGFRVSMGMGMGLGGDPRMIVTVMAVAVAVGMGMLGGVVMVMMGMPFEGDQPDSEGHEKEAGDHGPARRVTQNEQ